MIPGSDAYSPMASASRMQPVARFAWLTLAYNVAVIGWGAFVRATGSGAVSANHWPLCDGSILPGAPQLQTAIEFLHRVTSALAVVMVASLLVWCWRKTSKGDWPRYSAVLAIILLSNEALLGALLVVLNHVAQDQSAGHALLSFLHFGNTLLLLASLSLTARWLSSDDRRFVVTAKPRELLTIGMGLVAVMSVGIAGSLATLGGTIFPRLPDSGCLAAPRGAFLAVPNTIPSVISNRIYTFPKYAAFSARYPQPERRNVVSRFSVG
jgi:cytochrome c oxidase assembly protein subunit 15